MERLFLNFFRHKVVMGRLFAKITKYKVVIWDVYLLKLQNIK
jgi:hypothetical protein